MPCFHPWKAFRAAPPLTGLTGDPSKAYRDRPPMLLPCGQCIGCRIDKSREWAVRITHEAQLHEDNSFITLSFADEHYPWNGSVSVRDMQLFMKRLRKAVGKVRFFACGEYGTSNWRPHYHLILFGYQFPDRTLWSRTKTGNLLYRSALLEKLWPFGHCWVGTVTTQSAAYVARYCTKKVTGPMARDHYRRVHPLTGEEQQVSPEFICMSTRPGIGRDWYEEFRTDVLPRDYVVIDGKKYPVPAYYLRQRREEEQALIKAKRIQRSRKHADNNTAERLAVREELQHLRADRLQRDL